MIVWNVKVAILKGSLLSKTQERALHSTARLLTQEQMSARRAQTDRAGGREMSHWARGRLIQVSWFADILQTKVSLQRIRESLLTMRGGRLWEGQLFALWLQLRSWVAGWASRSCEFFNEGFQKYWTSSSRTGKWIWGLSRSSATARTL